MPERTYIQDQQLDEERTLYGLRHATLSNVTFAGPADGESALKESREIRVKDCFFNLRYPFWHDSDLRITGSELTPLCRAALWYSENVRIKNTKLHGIKALRECADVAMSGCEIVSPGIRLVGSRN